MIKALIARFRQKHRTMAYPSAPPPALPARFAGRPELATVCPPNCAGCQGLCPTGALISSPAPAIDMGKCLFCRQCQNKCPLGTVKFSGDHRLAAATREDLIVGAGRGKIATPPDFKRFGMFKKSLKLRQVSAGGCNACEADCNVLTTLAWDLGRFGIDFVASPRHADGLLITGPVPRNMQLALKKTFDAVPTPKVVIAVGACAISGGAFAAGDQSCGGVPPILPVDLFIPGCPPHPLTILDGLLRLIGRVGEK